MRRNRRPGLLKRANLRQIRLGNDSRDSTTRPSGWKEDSFKRANTWSSGNIST